MRGISEESLRHVMKMHDMDDSKTSLIFSHLCNECTELNAWQPIDENTPKDRHVLLYGGHVPCCQMFVGHANANWSWEPTHWQELPKDPK